MLGPEGMQFPSARWAGWAGALSCPCQPQFPPLWTGPLLLGACPIGLLRGVCGTSPGSSERSHTHSGVVLLRLLGPVPTLARLSSEAHRAGGRGLLSLEAWGCSLPYSGPAV